MPPNTTGEKGKERTAIEYAQQAQRLAQFTLDQEDHSTGSTQAIEAKWITPLDPAIETADGYRLPAVPIEEAEKLNRLRDDLQGRETQQPPESALREGKDGTTHGIRHADYKARKQSEASGEPLSDSTPPSKTNPLFPPLPMYGPPSPLRTLQCRLFRATSAVGSCCFLLVIILGATVAAISKLCRDLRLRLMFQDPDKQRPFYVEELKRRQERRAAERAWKEKTQRGAETPSVEKGIAQEDEFVATEGGPDPLVVDVAYYARRVGLDAETWEVQTEDGFIIELWHIYNPREYEAKPPSARGIHGPDVFRASSKNSGFPQTQPYPEGKKKYPVLMVHGLLQSAGAFCCNDDDSLAFYLAKSGYDVWLGNNRCGNEAKHTSLKYEDPRMWAWNIRQMGVMDLPALIGRVLGETDFPKLALIAHSQGTTETFVALAKEQRPDIGKRISVFCALAPAAYAGPLIGEIYFKLMQAISPAVFRLIFGIHSFIPLMLTAHRILPPKPYSWMGYHVFSYLFHWSDIRWDRGLRDRMFQWAPVYVSAESMRWWLGRECFAKQKCILSTRDETMEEDKEDEEDDAAIRKYYVDQEPHITERKKLQRNLSSFRSQTFASQPDDGSRGKYSWYDKHFPPLALWVCGADDLVDGRRLLRRFDRGREPHVRVVHQKIIEGYEHLDVIWAMDAIEKVGKEVREIIWRTAEPSSQSQCRVPVGCSKAVEEEPGSPDVPMTNSGGRHRMASLGEDWRLKKNKTVQTPPPTQVDVPRDSESCQRSYAESFQKLMSDEEQKCNGALSEPEFDDVREKRNPLE